MSDCPLTIKTMCFANQCFFDCRENSPLLLNRQALPTVETKLCFRKNHSSSCECIAKTYQIKRLQRQLCICVDANITESVKNTYIFLSLVYGFRCTQAGTKPPMKPRNNVKSELVKDLKRKDQCTRLDCQKWTVSAWSKVRSHQLLRYKLKRVVFQFVY